MIRARSLRVRFDDDEASAPALAIGDLEITVPRGSTLGLIGPPGGGKTTLLKVLAGLVAPGPGWIEFEDRRLPAPGPEELAAWQRAVGMSFQNDALFDALSIFENVAFPLRRRRIPEEELQQRVMGRLRDVGLEEAGPRLPGEVSGGMRKRAGIARATVINPTLGLFDDPIAGLDPVTGGRILHLIGDLTRDLHMATLIVSNDLEVLLPRCDTVLFLHGGEPLYFGSAEDLWTSTQPVVHQFVRGLDEGPL